MATKSRNKPCKPRGTNSKGINGGARRVRLDSVQKVLLGKGQYASFVPVGAAGNGRG